MKSFHVYGIGNALVDMEFEVDPKFLKDKGIEKGIMTLVDEDRQTELLAHLGGFKKNRQCGGSAANTIIALCQMGGKSYYSCKVASDETGDFYYKDLLKNGAQTNLTDNRPEGITGKCMVFVTEDADRTMNTYLGITGSFSEQELDEQALKDSEYLYIEGYLVASPSGKEAAIKAYEMAKEHGVKTALTFSDPSMVEIFKDGFKEMLGQGVDLLFCNESEALAWTGKTDIESAAQELKNIAKSFAITLGPKGAYLFDGETQTNITTDKVQAIDSNGAGDLFAGSFLYGITHGHTFAEAGRLACLSASKLVTQFGPRLENDQAMKLRKEILG